MTRSDFIASLKDSQPPEGCSAYLQALWYDAKGDWEKSHDLISALSSADAAHIHAYLHRKEGDQWNAEYWYRRAGVTRQEISLSEEWDMLVEKYII